MLTRARTPPPSAPLRAAAPLLRRRPSSPRDLRPCVAVRAPGTGRPERKGRHVRAEVALHVDADEVPAVLEDDEPADRADAAREPPRPAQGDGADRARPRRRARALRCPATGDPRARRARGAARPPRAGHLERGVPVSLAHLDRGRPSPPASARRSARAAEVAEQGAEASVELELERGREEDEAVDALGVVVREGARDERAHRAADDEPAPRPRGARAPGAPSRPTPARVRREDRARRRRAPPSSARGSASPPRRAGAPRRASRT